MAKAKKKASRRRPKSRSAAAQPNAIALLEADHRQVSEWFEQFESTRSQERKQKLAQQCCQALKVHTQIEEEIFYPAFLEATGEEDIHHEAEIEHEGAKRLIVDAKGGNPTGPEVVPMLESNLAKVPARVLSPAGKARVRERAEQLESFLRDLRQQTDNLRLL